MPNNDQIIYDIAIKNGFSPTSAKLIVGQARFESANYTSAVFRANNNTSGMKYIGQPLASRGTLAPMSERSATCRSGGVCNNSDHYAKFKSVQDSATDKIARLYNITMRGVTPQQLKSAKTPEEFARLLKKRGYYGPATFGTPAAEKEIKNYAAGVKLLMQRADIVELVTKNKNSILVGIVTIIAAIFLLRKKNK
tara:strand:+ start:169 stop:753 length:585 start_codon:yes stop_codon:yes gene_type:complete